MTCELIEGDGYRAFQCSNIGDREMTHKELTGKERLEPYQEDECEHRNRYEYKGVLRCKDCPMIYDENSLSWIEQ